MPSLIERIHAAREQWVDAGGTQWLIRRPTLHRYLELHKTPTALLREAVVGWKLREMDLVPGGGDQVPAFDPDAALEHLQDRPEAYSALLDAVTAAVGAFLQRKEAEQGKS